MFTNDVVGSKHEFTLSKARLAFLRIGAGCIDVVVLTSLQIWISSIFGTLDPLGDHYQSDGNGLSVFMPGVPTISSIWLYVIAFLYFFVQEALCGITVGKFVLRLHVISARGERLTLVAALLRNLVRFIDCLPMFYIVGLISGFFSPTFQRLGDRLAHTVVVPVNLTPTLAYPLSTVLKRGVILCIGMLIFMGFCLNYMYYSRPSLVLTGWANVNNSYRYQAAAIPPCGKVEQRFGDYVLNHPIQMTSISAPQWHDGLVSYTIHYDTTIPCQGQVTMHWNGFFSSGWSVSQVLIQTK
ncbi:RDD family protein [Dictyobacter arantiisoli]|uniref:RDD domain-containing protein n=1 Tax=Dictyobacter arantiisoli TaxID=2014874 RepID=A0A5A5TLM2_9CHLR|nr:RDD family protein [Dictyobacter arantiisoli]GCF11924.1 hypothetical protein KDI_54880 [Dictyobacter arantiisoli]